MANGVEATKPFIKGRGEIYCRGCLGKNLFSAVSLGELPIANELLIKKENKAEKEITKLIREDLKDFGTKLKPEIITNPTETNDEEEISLEKGPIVKGCWVRMKSTETIGEVLSINGNNVEMSIGDLRTNVKLNKLERISKREQNHQLKLFKNSNITSKHRGARCMRKKSISTISAPRCKR